MLDTWDFEEQDHLMDPPVLGNLKVREYSVFHTGSKIRCWFPCVVCLLTSTKGLKLGK